MSAFVGYSGQVWTAVYAALTYYQAQLATVTSAGTLATLSETMLATLFNAVSAINGQGLASAWSTEAAQLALIQTYPLTLDTTSEGYVLRRDAAYQAASVALAALIPQPSDFASAASLSQAIPTIPDMGLLGFYQSFAYETPPSGLTQGEFDAQAALVSTSFTNLAIAISVYQGVNLTSAYDAALREAAVTGAVANALASLTSGPVAANFATLNAWNQIVTLPAMAALGSMLTNNPATQQGQQGAVIRYALLGLAQQIATFLLILRQPTATQVSLTTLRNNETLLDVAARTLGDFEQWQAIAALNGLFPPYTAPVGRPGVAGWGQQLVLPAPGAQVSALGQSPSYTTNFLGTDIYLGSFNGPMPPWTGDYQLISGYQNLSWALGRRIQTTLSTLIYHPTYGSRIPPEVGTVQVSTEAAKIAAFGVSAILADPRVASVPQYAASGTAGIVNFSAQVQPRGQGATVGVNEVLSNLPAAS